MKIHRSVALLALNDPWRTLPVTIITVELKHYMLVPNAHKNPQTTWCFITTQPLSIVLVFAVFWLARAGQWVLNAWQPWPHCSLRERHPPGGAPPLYAQQYEQWIFHSFANTTETGNDMLHLTFPVFWLAMREQWRFPCTHCPLFSHMQRARHPTYTH